MINAYLFIFTTLSLSPICSFYHYPAEKNLEDFYDGNQVFTSDIYAVSNLFLFKYSELIFIHYRLKQNGSLTGHRMESSFP